jgi:hypothetical protein
MLSREELLDTPVSFNAYQKEKDYLQHIVLSRIYANTGNELIFKGGTSLQKCHSLNRFSEDLDFTATDWFRHEKIEIALSEVSRFYPSFHTKSAGTSSQSYVIRIRGPLFHSPLSEQTIRIDVSLREKVILPAVNYNIIPIYRDLHPYMVKAMDLREIFSEKIRALNTRKRARDLYDIYFLIKKNVKLDLLLVSEKMRLYKKMYDRNEAVERIKTFKVQWEKEIPALVLNPPQFSTVSSEVVEFLLSQ